MKNNEAKNQSLDLDPISLTNLTIDFFKNDDIYLKQMTPNFVLVHTRNEFKKMIPNYVWKQSIYTKQINTKGVFPDILFVQEDKFKPNPFSNLYNIKNVLFDYVKGNKYQNSITIHHYFVANALLVLKDIVLKDDKNNPLSNFFNGLKTKYVNIFKQNYDFLANLPLKSDNGFYQALATFKQLPKPDASYLFFCLSHNDLLDKNIILKDGWEKYENLFDELYEEELINDINNNFKDLIYVSFIDLKDARYSLFGKDILKRLFLHKNLNSFKYLLKRLQFNELKALYYVVMYDYMISLINTSKESKQQKLRIFVKGANKIADFYFCIANLINDELKLKQETQPKKIKR